MVSTQSTWWLVAHPHPPAPLRARGLAFWLLSQSCVVWVWRRSGHHPCGRSSPSHHTTMRFKHHTSSVIIWRGLILHHAGSTHKFTSWWSVRPTGRCPMARHSSGKTPRSPVPAAAPAPDAEPAVAPASEVPPDTAAQDGDGGRGGDDLGEAAARSADQQPDDDDDDDDDDDGRAEDAGEDISNGPTQTMRGVFGSPMKKSDYEEEDSADDEETHERVTPVEMESRLPKRKGAAAAAARCRAALPRASRTARRKRTAARRRAQAWTRTRTRTR